MRHCRPVAFLRGWKPGTLARHRCLGLQGSVPESLAAALRASDAVQQRQIIQQLTRNLLPIMEKGILDPVLSHRFRPPMHASAAALLA